MVELVMEKDPITLTTRFILTLTALDYTRVKLAKFDKLLLQDIIDSPDSSIADYLLGLEALARKIEQGEKCQLHG